MFFVTMHMHPFGIAICKRGVVKFCLLGLVSGHLMSKSFNV